MPSDVNRKRENLWRNSGPVPHRFSRAACIRNMSEAGITRNYGRYCYFNKSFSFVKLEKVGTALLRRPGRSLGGLTGAAGEGGAR